MNHNNKRISPDDLTTCNYWKESPPGPAQRELNQLFQNGLVKAADTPNMIRLKYPIFMQYTPRIFAAHFRKTKAKLGLNLGE